MNELAVPLDLCKVDSRERWKVQREPHWQRLRTGCFLAFRPSKRGDFSILPGNEIFAAAKKGDPVEHERAPSTVNRGHGRAAIGIEQVFIT